MRQQDISALVDAGKNAALLAKSIGGAFMQFEEQIMKLTQALEELMEEREPMLEKMQQQEEELLYFRTHYPPPNQLALVEKGESPPDQPPDENVSIFWHTTGKGLKICRERLEEILTTSKTKSEVCNRLANNEETFFNFNKHKNAVKARLLNANLPPNTQLGMFTEADFKKYWYYAKRKNRKPNTKNH